MLQWNRLPSAIGGRRIVVALGALYVASAAGWPLLPSDVEPTPGVFLIMGVLVGGPGFVLLYGWYRLPRSDIRSEVFSVVAKWCLAASA